MKQRRRSLRLQPNHSVALLHEILLQETRLDDPLHELTEAERVALAQAAKRCFAELWRGDHEAATSCCERGWLEVVLVLKRDDQAEHTAYQLTNAGRDLIARILR